MAHVIIAAHDQSLLDLLERIVKHASHEPLVTRLAESAHMLAIVRAIHTDLIIMDDGAPNLAAGEFIAAARQRTYAIPVVLLTSDAQMLAAAHEIELVYPLQKPCNAHTLIQLIRAACERGGLPAANEAGS